MYSNIEAQVALAKCREGKKMYGVRMEKTDEGWKYTWAFTVSEERAKAENYSVTKIKGRIYPDEEYPGCPYCGAKNFVVCSCGRLNCYNMEDNKFQCEWCGSKGELVDYKGEGFDSAGDI